MTELRQRKAAFRWGPCGKRLLCSVGWEPLRIRTFLNDVKVRSSCALWIDMGGGVGSGSSLP